MKIASQNEVAADFAAYLKASKSGPVVITNKGKPVAVIVRAEAAEDVERLLMGHSRKLQKLLERARKRFREGQGIPHDQFWKEVEADNAKRMSKRIYPRKNGRLRA